MKHLPLNLSYDGKDFPVDAEGGPSINLFALNVSKAVLRTLKVMIGRTGHNTAVKVKVTLALFKIKQQISLNFQPLASNNTTTTNNISPGGVCGICLRPLGACGGSSLVEHGGAWYHAACANLWVNRVDLTLPTLARES